MFQEQHSFLFNLPAKLPEIKPYVNNKKYNGMVKLEKEQFENVNGANQDFEGFVFNVSKCWEIGIL